MFGEAVLNITLNNDNVQQSNFGSNSFQITNTGEKNIAQIDINVTNALYPDAVFDPFGQAGDTASKPLTIDTNGGTGVIAPSNDSYIGVGGTAGFEVIRLFFAQNNNNGFEPGETIGFSVDMDPNSVASTNKGQLDGGSNPPWDVGGVSGAELIASTFTVTFTDGTTATGQLQGANNQAGSQTLASQNSPNLSVSLTVNGLDGGGIGTYNANGPSTIINGPAGQTARVVLTKGFIQPVIPYAQFLQDQLDALAASDFPANNAVEFQTVDVLLTGANQDISNLFDFSDVENFDFEGEDQLPLGFVASIIDPTNDDLPIGPVTEPIYLEFQEQIDGLLDTPFIRFQNSNVPGTYLYATGAEADNIRDNFTGFEEEGVAFNAAIEPDDELIPLFRFQSNQRPGTYLFVGEEERNSINNDPNFSNAFTEEGIAFHVYGAGANQETPFYRFQNSEVPGTYLYATGAEADNIRDNLTNFIDEGIAFEAAI